jgi:hypothetical protein
MVRSVMAATPVAKVPVALVTVLVVLATGGCTSSPEPTTAAPTPAAVAQPPSQARELLEGALRVLRRTNAVRFEAQALSAVNGEVTTRDTTGLWIGQPATWRTSVTVDSPRPPWHLPEGYTDKTQRLQFVDSRLSLSVTPAGERATTWIDLTDAAGTAGYAAALQPVPPEIELLSRIQPTSTTDSRGQTQVTGTIANRTALDLLGLTPRILEFGLVAAFRQGRTDVRLALDDGFPSRLEFLGADVDLTVAGLPTYRRTELAASSFRIHFQPVAHAPQITPPSRLRDAAATYPRQDG